MTDSKVSFMQMVGRVRVESVDALNLYFVLQDAEFFRKHEYAYKEQLEMIEQFNSARRENEWANLVYVW